MTDDKLPWFPFYAGVWMSDPEVLSLSGEEMGAYLWLLCVQWRQEFLPYEALKVAAFCPRRISQEAIETVLLRFFPPDPDTNDRRNPKLARIRERQLANYKSRAAAADAARKAKRDNNLASDQAGHQVGDEAEILSFSVSLFEGVGKGIPLEVIKAGTWYLRPEKTRNARLATLRGMLQGLSTFPVDPAALERALVDMTAAGADFRPVVVRSWTERAAKLLAGEAGSRAAVAKASTDAKPKKDLPPGEEDFE